MITKDQIAILAKTHKINELTIFREYLQLLFLEALYRKPLSRNIMFKGGTCIHLIYNAPRFSEDLDFTVTMSTEVFTSFISSLFTTLSKEVPVEFKERKTITGKRFLMIALPIVLQTTTFINLDFSFREPVYEHDKSLIQTNFPVIFTSFIFHLSKNELLAEKIRALMTRRKGRDLYDLWYLFNMGAVIDIRLVEKKLHYYNMTYSKEAVKKRIGSFSEKDFIRDLRPFVPIAERTRLSEFFYVVQAFILEKS